MRTQLFVATLLALSLFAGCLEAGEKGPTTPAPGTAVDSRELASGGQSGKTGPMRAVIEDEAAWDALWRDHASNELPPPARPNVDFSKEKVVAVLLEDKPNACWAVRITNATHEAAGVVVEVTTYSPSPDLMCASVVTQPFAFVAISATEGEVRFTERSEVGAPVE